MATPPKKIFDGQTELFERRPDGKSHWSDRARLVSVQFSRLVDDFWNHHVETEGVVNNRDMQSLLVEVIQDNYLSRQCLCKL